jgi:hypothetical protein
MDDRDLETIVFEALGEASTCWIPSTGNAVFDATRAQVIGDQLLAEIRSRIIGDHTDELIAERDHERGLRIGLDRLARTLGEERDEARAQRDRLAEKCDRLDDRRNELHDLLTAVEAERDQAELGRLRTVARDVWAALWHADPDDVELLTAEHEAMLPDVVRSALLAAAQHNRELETERDRLRAALTLIAIPPSNPTRDDHEFTACTGCAHVAQRALDGHDYQPNVAALDRSAEVTDG